jgi:Fe-S cluster biogenesis protein NfuA
LKWASSFASPSTAAASTWSRSPAGEVRLAFEGACCGCALKSVTYVLGIRQKLMPIPGVTEVTV